MAILIEEQRRLKKIEDLTNEINECTLRLEQIYDSGMAEFHTEDSYLKGKIRVAREELERLNAPREEARLERKRRIMESYHNGAIFRSDM